MKKRILIDGRFIGVGDSVSRYVLEMLKGILALDKTNQYTLLVRPVGTKAFCEYFQISKSEFLISNQTLNPNDQLEIEKFNENWKLKIENLTVKVMDIPHYTIAEQTKLLQYLNKEKFDLVHFTQFNHPIFYKGDYVVTIHDLTLVGHLHYFNFVKQMAFNMVMKSAAKDSRKIISISKTSMDDVMDYFGTKKEKFEIIYHGIDHSRFAASTKSKVESIKAFKEKYSIDGDYILYTGMWKKHKNMMRMFKAFEQLRAQISSLKTQLVIVGKIDQNEPEVLSEINRINDKLSSQSSGLKTIITTGFVDEEELPIAYAGALAYCIPSLAEGFGWPPLEAMACGTPVISSRESCMPEILGDAAYYFDPYNIEDITKAMEKIISDKDLQKDLVKKGFEQVKKYNWDECAKKTLKVYKEVLSIED